MPRLLLGSLFGALFAKFGTMLLALLPIGHHAICSLSHGLQALLLSFRDFRRPPIDFQGLHWLVGRRLDI
jgi:hypothetical protein